MPRIYTPSLFPELEQGVPIPECAKEYLNPDNPTPQSVADALLYSVVRWIDRNPGKDWRTIVPPPWLEYVSWRLTKF